MNIFLSPSNQTENVGEYRKYSMNECLVCEKIAQAAHDYLIQNYDCNVMVSERADRMTVRIAKAKEFKADIYVPIHTNAAGTSAAKGCEAFYFVTDSEGRKLATELRDAMVSLGCASRSIKAANYQELRDNTFCTRAYLEVDFHTHPERTKWLVENTEIIGQKIAETIATHCKLKKRVVEDKMYVVTATSAQLSAQQAEKAKSELEATGYKVTLTEQIKANEDKPANDVPEQPEEIDLAIGDRVQLIPDAVVYGTSKRFAGFVYKKTLYVREISGSRVVISTVPTGAVTGAVDKKYLKKV